MWLYYWNQFPCTAFFSLSIIVFATCELGTYYLMLLSIESMTDWLMYSFNANRKKKQGMANHNLAAKRATHTHLQSNGSHTATALCITKRYVCWMPIQMTNNVVKICILLYFVWISEKEFYCILNFKISTSTILA